MKGSVKEPNMCHNYETEEIEHNWVMGGKKKYIKMFGSVTEPFTWRPNLEWSLEKYPG